MGPGEASWFVHPQMGVLAEPQNGVASMWRPPEHAVWFLDLWTDSYKTQLEASTFLMGDRGDGMTVPSRPKVAEDKLVWWEGEDVVRGHFCLRKMLADAC